MCQLRHAASTEWSAKAAAYCREEAVAGLPPDPWNQALRERLEIDHRISEPSPAQGSGMFGSAAHCREKSQGHWNLGPGLDSEMSPEFRGRVRVVLVTAGKSQFGSHGAVVIYLEAVCVHAFNYILHLNL